MVIFLQKGPYLFIPSIVALIVCTNVVSLQFFRDQIRFETHYTAQSMSICCVVVGFAPANLTPIVRVCLPSQFNTCKLVCIYRLNLYSLLLYMLQYSNLSIERQPWLKWTWIRYCLKVLMHKCVVRYSCLQQMRFTWFDFSSCKSFETAFRTRNVDILPIFSIAVVSAYYIRFRVLQEFASMISSWMFDCRFCPTTVLPHDLVFVILFSQIFTWLYVYGLTQQR